MFRSGEFVKLQSEGTSVDTLPTDNTRDVADNAFDRLLRQPGQLVVTRQHPAALYTLFNTVHVPFGPELRGDLVALVRTRRN